MKKPSVKTVAVLSPVETVEIPLSLLPRADLIVAALWELRGKSVNIQWVLFPSLVDHRLFTDLFTAADRIATKLGQKPLDRNAVVWEQSPQRD